MNIRTATTSGLAGLLCLAATQTSQGTEGTWVYEKIEAPAAWSIVGGSGSPVTVGVQDQGINYQHIDLCDLIWLNAGEDSNGNGLIDPDDFVITDPISLQNWPYPPYPYQYFPDDNDQNGYVNDVLGYDFSELVSPDKPKYPPMDYNGHGTQVAGGVAAIGRSNVKLMALKTSPDSVFLDDTVFNRSDAQESIQYARDHGAKIINASWFVSTACFPSIEPWNHGYEDNWYSYSLSNKIAQAGSQGMLYVAAAGNGSVNIDTVPYYPASYDTDCILTVMATDENDTPWSASNFGATSVDIAAPGLNIRTCSNDGGWCEKTGTDMAASLVSGACALIWSYNPNLTNIELKDLIMKTADKLPALENKCVSEGRLNVRRAIECCKIRNITQGTWHSSYTTAILASNDGDEIKVFSENGMTTNTSSHTEENLRIWRNGTDKAVMLGWNTCTELTYRVVSTDDPGNQTWIPTSSGDITNTSSYISLSIPLQTTGHRFFSLQVKAGDDDYIDVEDIVGYSRQTIETNSMDIISNQFVDNNEMGKTISDAFDDSNLPWESVLYVHNGIAYDLYTFYGAYGWYDGEFNCVDDTLFLPRGISYWLSCTDDTASTDVLFCGKVPVSPTTTTTVSNGNSLLANPYPTTEELGDLFSNPADGSIVYVYNGVAYDLYTYYEGYGWWTGSTSADDVEVPVGKGFWYDSSAGKDWIVERPY